MITLSVANRHDPESAFFVSFANVHAAGMARIRLRRQGYLVTLSSGRGREYVTADHAISAVNDHFIALATP